MSFVRNSTVLGTRFETVSVLKLLSCCWVGKDRGNGESQGGVGEVEHGRKKYHVFF